MNHRAINDLLIPNAPSNDDLKLNKSTNTCNNLNLL